MILQKSYPELLGKAHFKLSDCTSERRPELKARSRIPAGEKTEFLDFLSAISTVWAFRAYSQFRPQPQV